MGVGGYSKCGINSAVCVRCDYAFAYIFWVKAALDTGSIVYLPSSCIGDYQFPRISRAQWKCMFLRLCFCSVKCSTIWHFFFCFFVALEPVCLLSSIQDLLKRLNMAEFQAYHEGVTGGYNNRFNLSSNTWI